MTTRVTLNVQQYGTTPDGPVLVWPQPDVSFLNDDVAAQYRAGLTRNRRQRNLTILPDGIEFDTYTANGVPLGCPELAYARTRVTFASAQTAAEDE